MSINQKDQKLIDQSLRNELDEQGEKILSERLMDDEFRNEFKAQEQIVRALFESERNELRSVMNSREQKFQLNKNKWKYLITALLILVPLVFGIKKIVNSRMDSEELYLAYFDKYPNVVDPIKKDSPDQINHSGYISYELGKFEEATTVLESIPPSDTSLFYLGLNYMQQNKFELAKKSFNEILNKESSFYEAKMWYSSLASLKLNEEEISEKILIELSNNGEFYKNKASELLSKLD